MNIKVQHLQLLPKCLIKYFFIKFVRYVGNYQYKCLKTKYLKTLEFLSTSHQYRKDCREFVTIVSLLLCNLQIL